MNMVPEETARTYRAIPISLQDGLLIIGMLHPDDPKGRRRSRSSRGRTMSILAFISFRTTICRRRSGSILVSRRGGGGGAVVEHQRGIGRTAGGELEGGDSADAPIIKIVADTFKEAVLSKASDVHIEPQQKTLRIRFRIQGDLQEVASLPQELAQPIAFAREGHLEFEDRRTAHSAGRPLPRQALRPRHRLPRRHVPDAARREDRDSRARPTTGLKNFESLDIIDRTRETIKKGLAKPFGMILITGPTGSGKTTTLYAFLQSLNTIDVNIVSLEDPVEYFVAGINQSQVHPEIGYDFASGLRQILRQDPDIIMVGEIRDGETAGLSVQAALTGHVVLSTLHTNNAAGVIPRLIDLKVEPFLLPVSLNLIIAQRLVGVLCRIASNPKWRRRTRRRRSRKRSKDFRRTWFRSSPSRIRYITRRDARRAKGAAWWIAPASTNRFW